MIDIHKTFHKFHYREHAAELNNAVPTTPILFMKPPSCYLANGGTIEVQVNYIIIIRLIIRHKIQEYPLIIL